MDSKQETLTLDVSDGKPITKALTKKTTVLMKGKNVPERTLELNQGTYVFNEVLKNIFTTNGKGGYEKIGSQHFLIAEKVG